MMAPIYLMISAAIALSVIMAGAWWVAHRPGKSGWGDAIWSLGIGMGGVWVALAPIYGRPDRRQWVVAVLVAVWSVRLASHIAARSARAHDDPRYAELRRQWGKAYPARLFLFFQVQAAAAALLCLSILVAARNTDSFPVWTDRYGTALLIFSILGEALADHQLKNFRKNAYNHDRVCTAGLWGWSRHPNYFFEWLGWCAYAVIAIGPHGMFGWGWVALSGPAFMYWLLVHVSGIPLLEAHMLRSRGQAYREVQMRINAFWPAPPRRSKVAAR